jgi:hypothetical protein
MKPKQKTRQAEQDSKHEVEVWGVRFEQAKHQSQCEM